MRSPTSPRTILAGGLCLLMAASAPSALAAVGNMSTNRTIPMNELNYGTDLPLSNPTGSVTTPMDAVTLRALNNEWNVLRQSYVRLGQQLNRPEWNANSQALTRDMIHRAELLRRQVPPAAAGLTGSDRNQVVEEYRQELAMMIDQLDQVLAELQMSDNPSAIREFNQIELMHARYFGLE